MKNMTLKIAAIIAIVLLTTSPGIAAAAPPVAWSQTVIETLSGSFIMGNPAARNHVIEYASYTCSHCAAFEASEAPKLKIASVNSGKAKFEIRTLVRDPIDLTLAMLARCGGKAKFFGNHKFLMANQIAIQNKAGQISAASKTKLENRDITGFMLGAYSDMQLDSMMSQRGVTNAASRICLSDKAALNKILALGQEASSKYAINGTPSFIINGKLAEVKPTAAAIGALLTQ